MAPARLRLTLQLFVLHLLLAAAREEWSDERDDKAEVSTRFNQFFRERAERIKALKDAESDAVQEHVAAARARAEAAFEHAAAARQALAVKRGVHTRPPNCPASPVPYTTYTTGNLGGDANVLGQNGWFVASIIPTGPVPYGPARNAPTPYGPSGTQRITDQASRRGRQSWQAGDCGNACNAAVYVAYPGPGLGGFGPGAVGEGAPADRFRNSLWVRTYAEYGDPITPGAFLEIELAGYDNTDQKMTYLAFGDVDGNGKLVARSQHVVGVDAENAPLVASQTSQPLVVGAWYQAITEAHFAAGPLNDVVRYEVRDESGEVVWESTVGSWEAAYLAGSASCPCGRAPSVPTPGCKFVGNRLVVRPQGYGGASPQPAAGGFYVDDIAVTTWNQAAPRQPLYCFTTGFEATAGVGGLL